MPFHPLLLGIGELAHAPLENLRSVDWVACCIRRTGLSGEAAGYDMWDRAYCLGKNDGLFQHPIELASFLVRMSTEGIASYLEVGTWAGWTAAFTTAYLMRFRWPFTALTIDPSPRLDPEWHHIEAMLPLRHLPLESSALKGQRFDLVFIDGDHAYRAVAADYENVGQYARVCAFHDIRERYVMEVIDPEQGGSVAFWRDLVGQHMTVSEGMVAEEICLHNEPDRMGIGLLFQGDD